MLSLCVCEIIVVVCVREAAGGEGARDTESKTRTPHKVVGNKWLGIPNCNRCSSNLVHSNYIKVPGAACWVALQRSASQFWHAHGTPTAATLTMSSQKWLTIDVYHIKVYHTIWCHMLSYSNWSQRRIQTRTSFSCKSQVTWLVKLRSGTEGHIVWPPFSNCNILIHLALINREIETTTKHIKTHQNTLKDQPNSKLRDLKVASKCLETAQPAQGIQPLPRMHGRNWTHDNSNDNSLHIAQHGSTWLNLWCVNGKVPAQPFLQSHVGHSSTSQDTRIPNGTVIQNGNGKPPDLSMIFHLLTC